MRGKHSGPSSGMEAVLLALVAALGVTLGAGCGSSSGNDKGRAATRSAGMTMPRPVPMVQPLLVDNSQFTSGRGSETTVENGRPERADRWVSGVVAPTMTIYLPPPAIRNGTAVIVCPGGGYGGLAIDKEGHDVARWLAGMGITAAVVKYRMPVLGKEDGGQPLPIADGMMAVKEMRAHAANWGVNPAKVGIFGFSAGGHLAASVATQGRGASRPDFVILGYPVISMLPGITHGGSHDNLLGKDVADDRVRAYSNELLVSSQTPPAFVFHSRDDDVVKIDNPRLYEHACKAVGVPCEYHEYATGGHGFGFGHGESSAWAGQLVTWMTTRGLLREQP